MVLLSRRSLIVLGAAVYLLFVPALLDAGWWPGRRAALSCSETGLAPINAQMAIRTVLDEQMVAWNKGDLDAFMRGYWASPELSFFSSSGTTRGWQATLERYQKKYRAEGKEMGKLTFSDLDIDVLGPDSALVRGHWQLHMSKDDPGGLFTLIFRRFPEGWRIVHDHTS
jgi:ketosteroid isomerase-like protein